MLCPVCCSKAKVLDTRMYADYVRRRQECIYCGYRFTTIEIDKDVYERITRKGDSDDK